VKKSILCRRLYVDGGKEHLCTRNRHHDGECRGHETSRDLVPPHAEKIVIPFVGTMFVWLSEHITKRSVYLAYAAPPLDLMVQGEPDGGPESAIKRMHRTIEIDRYWEGD